MKIKQVDMSLITDYIPIEKQLLLDAQKYLERADMYHKIGKPKHCLGCMIKAYRKMEQAERFGQPIEMIPGMKPMLDLMAKQVEDTILRG